MEKCKCERSKKCLPRSPRAAGSIALPSTAGWHPDRPGWAILAPRYRGHLPWLSPGPARPSWPSASQALNPGRPTAQAQRCRPASRAGG